MGNDTWGYCGDPSPGVNFRKKLKTGLTHRSSLHGAIDALGWGTWDTLCLGPLYELWLLDSASGQGTPNGPGLSVGYVPFNSPKQMHQNAIWEWFQITTNLLFWNGSERCGKMCPSLMFPSFWAHLSIKMHFFTFSKFSVTYVPFVSVTYVPFNQRKFIPKQQKRTLLEPFRNSTILEFWNRLWGSKLKGT